MDIERKRQRFAQLLLAIFVPVLLLTITHQHRTVPVSMTPCPLCLHHIHDSGHLSSGAILALQDCVLCHFSTIPYLLPELAVLPVLALSSFFLFPADYKAYIFVFYSPHSSRAPPYLKF